MSQIRNIEYMLPRVISNSIEVIRVLHIDDDPNQYDFIKFFLNQIDPILKVECVAIPEKVFEELEKNHYDCLVTDFQMPEMNGIELSKKVREKYTIPIILYTGQGSEEVAEAAFTVGVDDYLRKEMDPSHYQILAKRIRQVVEKKQAEILYQTVVEQTRDALCIFVEEKIVFANKSALDLFGVKTLEEIIKINPFRRIPNFEKYIEVGFHEYMHIKKNNEPLYIELSNSPINYNGKNAILCFIRDITEKRLLEQDNEVSQERFKTLVDLMPDGILSMTPFGYISFVNDTFLKLTGFKREEIVNKHLTSIGTIPKRDLIKHIQTFALIIQGNIPPPMEFHWKKKDGSPGIGEAHISLIEVNNKKEILLIARDITSQKKREKEFEIIFNNASDGILEMTPEGIIVSINDAATEYTELDKKDILGKHFNTVFNINEGDLNDILRTVNKRTPKKTTHIKLFDRKNRTRWIKAFSNIIEVNAEEYGVQLILKDQTDYNPTNEMMDIVNDIKPTD